MRRTVQVETPERSYLDGNTAAYIAVGSTEAGGVRVLQRAAESWPPLRKDGFSPARRIGQLLQAAMCNSGRWGRHGGLTVFSAVSCSSRSWMNAAACWATVMAFPSESESKDFV